MVDVLHPADGSDFLSSLSSEFDQFTSSVFSPQPTSDADDPLETTTDPYSFFTDTPLFTDTVSTASPTSTSTTSDTPTVIPVTSTPSPTPSPTTAIPASSMTSITSVASSTESIISANSEVDSSKS
ncbi:hypothetical protein FRB90_005046, partial [Tulasnella sp. 427]